jgi:O-antigen ligase
MVTKKSTKAMTENERQLLSLQLNSVLFYATFGLLIFGPIAFGAVEPWSIFLLETGAVLLTILWFATQWLNGEVSVQWNAAFLPMAGFGLLIGAQVIFRKTAYPHDTVSGAMLYVAYGLLCFLAAQTLVRASQARKLASIFVVYGCAMAAFGLLQGVAPNGKLYWLRQPRLGGNIYGPYVNHNHYAGLMEMLVPIALVLALSDLAHEKERAAAGAAAALMAGTVFLSGSRGGMLAIIVELGVFFVLLVQQKKGARIAMGAAAFAVVLVGLLTWLGGKELTQRISSISTETRTEISGGMRLSIDRDSLRMFRQKPVLGWGLQTFPVVYPQFRSFYTNFFVNEAHNDYLQLLVEMGLAGFGIMVWFLIVVYRNGIPKIKNWSSSVSGAVALATTLGVTGILVHSFLDFNLQIPANAALFYVFGTIAASPRLLQRSRKRKPTTSKTEDVVPATEVV